VVGDRILRSEFDFQQLQMPLQVGKMPHLQIDYGMNSALETDGHAEAKPGVDLARIHVHMYYQACAKALVRWSTRCRRQGAVFGNFRPLDADDTLHYFVAFHVDNVDAAIEGPSALV